MENETVTNRVSAHAKHMKDFFKSLAIVLA